MNSPKLGKVIRDNSNEDFVFLDVNDDLDVDLSKSPIHEAAGKLESGISSIISALSVLVEEENFNVTIPVTAMATTAVGAITGSLLGGPSGLAIGLITGAVMAYRTSPTRQKSPKGKSETKGMTIRQVFSQMTLQQKKELLMELLGCLKQSNVRTLMVEILKNEKIRNTVLSILSNFLLKKMGICLTRSK